MFKPLPVGSTVACDTVIGFNSKLKKAIMCAKPTVVTYKGFHLCSEHWDMMRIEPTTTVRSQHGNVS